MTYCSICRTSYPAGTRNCPLHGRPLETREAFEVGSIIKGKYEILRAIGHGAMADVFEVRDIELPSGTNIRAMKVPQSRLFGDARYMARFADEGNKTLSINHPGIVRAFSLEYTVSRVPVLIMEMIPGKTLTKWMEHSLPARFAAIIGVEVARALEAAHSVGLIHGDLKPENVMSTTARHPVPLKVLDFGLAKATEVFQAEGAAADPHWGGGDIAGTWNYMAPEQATGRSEIGPPSDIYSLGAILYELITGCVPFEGITNSAEARRAHQDQQRKSLLGQPGLAVALARVVESMLQPDPVHRPTAAEVIAGLNPFVSTDDGQGAKDDADEKRRIEVERALIAQREAGEKARRKTEEQAHTVAGVPPTAPRRTVWAAVIAAGIGAGALFVMFGPKDINQRKTSDFSIPTASSSSSSSSSAPVPDNDRGRSPSGERTESPAPPKATTAILEVSCDLPCAWSFDETQQGKTGLSGSVVNAPQGTHWVAAVATENSSVSAREKIILVAGTRKVVSFALSRMLREQTANTQATEQGIREGNSRGKRLFDQRSYREALSEYNRVLKLDPNNETAKTGKQEVLAECGPLSACNQ